MDNSFICISIGIEYFEVASTEATLKVRDGNPCFVGSLAKNVLWLQNAKKAKLRKTDMQCWTATVLRPVFATYKDLKLP